MRTWIGTTRTVIGIVAGIVLGIVPGSLGCSHPEPRPNVVVIVMDTVRPDFLSAYGHPRPTSPFLDELATKATRYDRAYSTSCWTLPAHASLFSGEPPEVHRTAQSNTQFPVELPLLAEQLAATGYQTAGFSNNPWVSSTTGLDRGFESFRDRARLAAGNTGDGVHPTVGAISEWLASERDAERPAFVFVNLIEPHMPYRPAWSSAEEFFAAEQDWRKAMTDLFPPRSGAAGLIVRHYGRAEPLHQADWPRLAALYEAEVRSCDEVVRQIVAKLDAALDPKDTLLFVLSDHGENLGDHDHVNHVFNLYDSNLRIALLARGHGFAPGAHESKLVQISDLYPTILAAAGVRSGATQGALDLRTGLPDERVLHASLDWPKISLTVFPDAISADGGPLDRYKRALAAAVTSRWKMIRGTDGSVEVYDLLADPNETTPVDLESLEPRTFAALQAFLDHTAASALADPGTGADLPSDPDTLDALRALGYTR